MSSPPILLAHAAGDELLAPLSSALRAAGIRVQLLALQTAAEGEPEHRARLLNAASKIDGKLIVGGFSLGARIAVELCPELSPAALLCLGFPFHKRGQPQVRPGLQALLKAKTPTLIIQGSRDCYGSEAEVRGYALPDHIDLLWLADANHRLVPRLRSGLTREAHSQTSAEAALSFIRAFSEG